MSEKIEGYNPKEIEDSFYKIWEERGYFEIDGNIDIQKDDKKFSIMLPPPNVTGTLHIGHALNHTLSDIIVRYKRMDGFKTLWQAGTDHAGIATQNVVEKQLLSEGIKKEDIGREKFLERVWSWKEYSGGAIVNQMRKLGVSPAWSRERFTMDDGLREAVKIAFVKLYEEGFIVRDNYMVNWCTKDGALSDIEVDYKESCGKLYHIRYYLENSTDYIVVATTRPETYFGDSAVMVNPNDERYSHLIGKFVTLPIINRAIKIIGDEYVDMSFGTGVVKVTPAHDPNDYEVGNRHNLEFIKIFCESGILNSKCGEFEGLERLEAREIVAKKLTELGFIEKIEEHNNQVGHCYRCGNVIEPYISKQWFIKKELANGAIKKTNSGETLFFPPSWKNNYDAWMRELRDWCISRQLWWGHRIPIFYCDSCGFEFASTLDNPDSCPKCNSNKITQDKDVLDTWFSSALWTFTTLGWGNGEFNKSQYSSTDLKDFYPNTLLITGFDILFFWVARMMMMGEHFLREMPFHDVYLHALVRDEFGNKMSKSRGNVIDPLVLVDSVGADSLRFTLAYLAVQGRDIKLSSKVLEISKNFTNKLYNAHKFLLLNESSFPNLNDIEVQSYLGKYLLSKFNRTVKEIREALDSYRFNDGALALYKFLWGEFCDWGIELSKASKESISEIGAIFKESMKLLSPFMPFISEYIYHNLNGTTLNEDKSIMIMEYPKISEFDLEIEKEFSEIIDAIISLRRAKATVDLANKRIDLAFVKLSFQNDLSKSFIQKLAKVDEVKFTNEKIDGAVCDVGEVCEVFIPLNNIDTKPIIERLTKQKEKLEKEIVKLESMLNNEKFIANAKPELIETNRVALNEAKERFLKLERELNSFAKN